jgi:hypothetical protein
MREIRHSVHYFLSPYDFCAFMTPPVASKWKQIRQDLFASHLRTLRVCEWQYLARGYCLLILLFVLTRQGLDPEKLPAVGVFVAFLHSGFMTMKQTTLIQSPHVYSCIVAMSTDGVGSGQIFNSKLRL